VIYQICLMGLMLPLAVIVIPTSVSSPPLVG